MKSEDGAAQALRQQVTKLEEDLFFAPVAGCEHQVADISLTLFDRLEKTRCSLDAPGILRGTGFIFQSTPAFKLS